MKIFRERSRTSRRGTCSFSSITAAALQNAQRVPAFSSSLFQLSLLLSLFRLLSQNPFLPASSICLGPRFYFYTQRCYHPPTHYSFHFPLPSLRNFSLSLSPPYSSLPLSVSLPTLPHSVCSPPPSIPYAIPSPSPSLCSWPFLFKRRDCSLHILRDQPRSVCSSLSIYPSMLYSSVRQLNPFSSHHQDFTLRASPPPLQCFVRWLTFKFYSLVENLQCKICWIYFGLDQFCLSRNKLGD